MTGLGNHKLIAIAGEWDTKSECFEASGRKGCQYYTKG